MGRRFKNRRKNKTNETNRDGAKKAEQTEDTAGDRRGAGYADIVKENLILEKYYKLQNIISEDQWGAFMAIIKESLPSSFRITGYKTHSKALMNVIEHKYFKELGEAARGIVESKDEDIALYSYIPWYPDKLAWQLSLTRKELRKLDVFDRFHAFLTCETEIGYISRQETVSMIPPLLLDIQPHHKVLDCCAAPGSKSAQIIEMLHAGGAQHPDGVLVANDADNKRCYMLIHQAKRLQSTAHIVTNHDASTMPEIKLPSGEFLRYDRVLCDVPCSGDGTIRKNYDIWKKWSPANGNGLHPLQVKIAKRGLELLAVDGLMVYSTCSLNPIEDEAVVHHLLSISQGSVIVEDSRSKLPALIGQPGLTNWKVTDRQCNAIESFEKVPEDLRRQLMELTFAPQDATTPEVQSLTKCVRILPHQQNTGGFFVALLRKVKPLPWEQSLSNNDATSNKSGRNAYRPPPQKRGRFQGHKEDPFVFFTTEDQLWPSIRDFFGIEPSFDHTLLLTRCAEGKIRNIYLTTKTVKEIVQLNEANLKVVNTGIRAFVRTDNDRDGSRCTFRLTQDGISAIYPFIGTRIINVPKEDVICLLTEEFPQIDMLTEATREHVKALDPGSMTWVYRGVCEDSEGEPMTIILSGWKGKASARAYVMKNERQHFLRLCGVDKPTYIQRSEEKTTKAVDEEVDDKTTTTAEVVE